MRRERGIANAGAASQRGRPVVPKRTRGKKNRRGLLLEPEEPSSLKLGTLEELMQARTSVLDPPWEGSNLIPGDILWSDPSLTPGLSPNEQRGIGLLWGPDYTEEFLKKYQLKATRERYRNKGAYIILQAPDFSGPQFRSFEAVTPRPKANPYYDFENVIDSDDEMDKSAMDSNEEQAASH
uniref:Uncharacterized protein n=1 Tax=Brassica campestris TaxID=3711 RepID=M4E639_BRACM|nr:unnamed protein product [Brassica rapa]